LSVITPELIFYHPRPQYRTC